MDAVPESQRREVAQVAGVVIPDDWLVLFGSPSGEIEVVDAGQSFSFSVDGKETSF
jgi:hypothetical protein